DLPRLPDPLPRAIDSRLLQARGPLRRDRGLDAEADPQVGTPEMSPRQQALAWALVAALTQGAIVLGSVSTPLFFGRVGAVKMFDDVDKHYFPYASKAIEGQVPYRDYEVEYPVLALPFLLLPRTFALDLSSYRFAFGLGMWLCNAAAVALVACW